MIKNRGFTIIELLVVIAIIGLLASIVLVSLNSARMKARDVRRRADLYSLELAIQLYYDSVGAFPEDAYTGLGDWPDSYKAQLAPYISNLPLDPKANKQGRYYASYRMTWAPDESCNGQYVVWGYIEGDNTGAKTCGFSDNIYFRFLGRY